MVQEFSANEEDAHRRIVREAKQYYHTVKQLYRNTKNSHQQELSQIWDEESENMKQLHDIITSDATAIETLKSIHNTYMYSVNPPGRLAERMVDWHVSYLRQTGHDVFDLDPTVQESFFAANSTVRDGRLLSPDFLRTVELYYEIRKHCRLPDSSLRVVELGGGSGRLARTLKLFMPLMRYVDIDIPETLYFAYIFLRVNFPQAKTCFVTDPSQLEKGIDQFDLVFIPTILAESVATQDYHVFINTNSLGEMPNPTIRYWMDFVQNRLKVKYSFTLNRFLNTVDLTTGFGRRRLGENECSVWFDKAWDILHWELEPPFTRCPYEETQISRSLEVVGERLPTASVDEDNCKRLSQQLIQDLMDEDWFRMRHRDTQGTRRGNVLAPDLSMKGTLFSLWEAIRLRPDRTNVAMMMIYLHSLTRTGAPFEEWFYYKGLFDRLTSGLILLASDEGLSNARVRRDEYRRLEHDGHALLNRYRLPKVPVWISHVASFLPSWIRSPLRQLYIRLGGAFHRAM